MKQEDYVLPRATELPFLSAFHVKNDTTKLYFSSQLRKQFKLLAVHLSHYAVVCEVINL